MYKKKNFEKDIAKEHLYESVKTLVETEAPHIHLYQQKLFTLFSVAFQYLLFLSTKKKGHYIIRIEDSFLADKLARRSKDDSTRKFMEKLLVPRRLKYGESTFHLDYFNVSSWSATAELPKEKIVAALVVKNTTELPMIDETDFRNFGTNPNLQTEVTETAENSLSQFPKDYFLTTLQGIVPKIIAIAFDYEFEDVTKVAFPFIKNKESELVSGVKVSADVDLGELE